MATIGQDLQVGDGGREGWMQRQEGEEILQWLSLDGVRGRGIQVTDVNLLQFNILLS